MTYIVDNEGIRTGLAGRLATRTTALPPASGASEDLFTVNDGRVQLLGFAGYVTVAIPSQSIDFDLALDPDDGGSDVALATALAVDADASGTIYTLNPTAGGVLVATLDVAYNTQLATSITLTPGDIKLNVAGGGAIGTTARVQWDALWVPFDDGATLTQVAAP